MKKTLKSTKIVLACLTALCALCLAAAAFVPVGTTAASVGNETFFIQGASVRYESQPSGLRFHAAIEKNEFDKLSAASDFRTGFLVMPAVMLGDDDLTVDKVGAGAAADIDTTGKYAEETVGGKTHKVFRGYIYDIPVEEYKTELTAVAYVFCDGAYTYTQPVTRSITKVAQTACLDADLEEDVKTALYNEYIAPFKDLAVDYTLNYTVQNADGSYGDPVTEIKHANVNAAVAAEEREGFVLLGEYQGVAFIDGSTSLNFRYAKKVEESAFVEGGTSVSYGNDGTAVNVTLEASDDTVVRLGSKNYIYTHDDYAAGSNFIALEFKGANFPGQVIFGATDLSANAGEVFGMGLNFDMMDGSVFLRSKDDSGALKVGNPSLVNLTGADSIAVNGGTYFNIQSLRSEFKDKDLVLVAGTYVDPLLPARRGFKCLIYEKTGENRIELKDSYFYSLDDMQSQDTGKIYVSGANFAVSANNDTVFTMSRPGTLENVINGLSAKYPESELYAPSYRVHYAANEDGSASAEIAAIGAGGFGYIQTGFEYVSGQYVRVDFTGADAPGQIVFGAADSGVKFQPVGIGFDLDVNNFSAYVRYKPDAETAENREAVTIENGKLQRGYFRNAGLDGSNTKGNFSVICRAVQQDAGVDMEYYIYLKVDAGYTLVEHKTASLAGAILPVGNVMVTNSQAVSAPTKVTVFNAGSYEEVFEGFPAE